MWLLLHVAMRVCGDGNAVFKAMMDKGVIVRALAAYNLPEWVRISVGTMPMNERCLEVLKAALGKQG